MPIIDAAMRQLNQTGWMHNRCRMIVASYLVKDLICDWRWGERAFMELEVDGDLAANNGGWQWSASSGMDPKPLRIFNPATQASKFDSAGDYIRQWVPELRHVNTKDLLSGEIGALERRDYPEPLVDHKKQQAKFKALYATIRIKAIDLGEGGGLIGAQRIELSEEEETGSIADVGVVGRKSHPERCRFCRGQLLKSVASITVPRSYGLDSLSALRPGSRPRTSRC